MNKISIYAIIFILLLESIYTRDRCDYSDEDEKMFCVFAICLNLIVTDFMNIKL